MPLRSINLRRGRVRSPGALALVTGAWLSCAAPDGSGLFQPLGMAGAGASGGSGGASSGGSGSGAPAGGASAAEAGEGQAGEGQAGNLPLAGAPGNGGASAGAGAGGGDALAPDAGLVDGGVEPDAGSPEPPVTCEPSDELCDGVDNDCDGVIDSASACPAGCTGFTLTGRVYMFCSEAVDRGIALARCGAEDMKVAWIETPAENGAVLASLTLLVAPAAGERLVQLGASDQDDEDEWFWTSNAAAFDGFQFWDGNAAEDGGDPVGNAYANWGPGEPNNSDNEDCGALSVSGTETRAPGQWDDRSCLEELPFLCEQP